MKERPILFSAPMVRAILEGRKTQTRRVVKLQPKWRQDILSRGLGDPCPGVLAYQEGPGIWHCYGSMNFCEEFCPYGKPGDRLWVRESFCPYTTTVYSDQGKSVSEPKAIYAADGGFLLNGYKWKPSIHMPRWASRITLEITEVRVQRLQEISEGDAVAEGVDWSENPLGVTPVDYFRDLWESINGAGAWSQNPWVWAVSFRRIDA